MFKKNVNAGEYDLIGVGVRALQVVSEGCVRLDTGENRRETHCRLPTVQIGLRLADLGQ